MDDLLRPIYKLTNSDYLSVYPLLCPAHIIEEFGPIRCHSLRTIYRVYKRSGLLSPLQGRSALQQKIAVALCEDDSRIYITYPEITKEMVAATTAEFIARLWEKIEFHESQFDGHYGKELGHQDREELAQQLYLEKQAELGRFDGYNKRNGWSLI